MDRVIERVPNGLFPLVGYSSPEREEIAVIAEQTLIGRKRPLNHVTANILGLAFVGKIGDLDEAWEWYIEDAGFSMMEEQYPHTGSFLEFLGLFDERDHTGERASYLLCVHQGWYQFKDHRQSAVEIVTRLRNGTLGR